MAARWIIYLMKKWLICYWLHDGYKCYPEFWDRGLKGPWHCAKCHPCNDWFKKLQARSLVAKAEDS
jgi:hypothetical protein